MIIREDRKHCGKKKYLQEEETEMQVTGGEEAKAESTEKGRKAEDGKKDVSVLEDCWRITGGSLRSGH